MEVLLLGSAKGHRVLFQPPHHSDLQPIELLWAKLKGNIGRKYDSETTMSTLKHRLDKEFEDARLWYASVEGFIRKSTSIAADFYKSALVEDANDSDLDNNNTSDNSSDSSDNDEEREAEIGQVIGV